MKIWSALPDVPGDEKSVITIGNFDGMHNGYRRVAPSCTEHVRRRDTDAAAITFNPHPIQIRASEASLQPIFPLRDCPDTVATSGPDVILVVHYDASVYVLEPEEFVTESLVERLDTIEVVVGGGFHFGCASPGTINTLRELGRRYGLSVTIVTGIQVPEGRYWSSSWVRKPLVEGGIAGAA